MTEAAQQCPECLSPLRPCKCERADEYLSPPGAVANSTLGIRKGGGLSRSTRIRPRNPERSEAETLRAYGPPERREAVKAMPCCVPGCRRKAENAHIRTGGTGYKADARWIAPICRWHHTQADDSFHRLGSAEAFDREHGTDLEAEAARVERLHPTRAA